MLQRVGRPRSALDFSGHHRVACARAGIADRAPESVVAGICRDAGGRVRTNMFVRDMDLDVPVCSNFFLFSRKKSDLGNFSFCFFSVVRMAHAPSIAEVVAGEEKPVMAVAEVHERPGTSPSSFSRRNSLQGKVTRLQAPGGDSDARWRRPCIGRVAGGFVEGQESSVSTLSRRPGCVDAIADHDRLRMELADGERRLCGYKTS